MLASKGCCCLWDDAALAHSLHNPNIRADRRTTLDAFLHTNRNYGKEVSRGQSLPDSLLTSLYSTCGYSYCMRIGVNHAVHDKYGGRDTHGCIVLVAIYGGFPARLSLSSSRAQTP